MTTNSPVIDCVDLFCGLGGLSHGLLLGGIDVKAGIDSDDNCRFPYEANNPSQFICKDINHVNADDFSRWYKKDKLHLLAGCAPCQPFSTYGRSRSNHRKTGLWGLLAEFGRLVEEVKPHIITMENVPHLAKHSVFKDFLKSLNGYFISWKIVDCTQYGIPQTRKRLVLLASRMGTIDLLPPTEESATFATVRSAISFLPPIAAGESDPIDTIHASARLSELNLKRIRASRPGGTWRDWSVGLVANCHQKITGLTFPSVYGRMEWDAPSPTITTQCYGYGNGRFGHPEQDRAISLREAAILQTFPSNYQFFPRGEKIRFNVLGRLIGNAVPVQLGRVIAESIVAHVNNI